MSKVKDELLFRLIHDFLMIYLPSQRNSSQNTIRSYRSTLEMMLDYIKENNHIPLNKITFRMINKQTVSSFLDYIEHEKGCSISTRNHRLKCIKAFIKYAAMIEPTVVIYQTELSKIPMKKELRVKAIEYMSETAIKTLLNEPDVSDKRELRNQFFMILAYDTGARIQELIDLQLCHLRLGKNPMVILTGKGGKVRTVPLMNITVRHLEYYLKIFHPNETLLSTRPLFYTKRRDILKPLSDDGIRKWMKQYGISAREKCSEIPDNVHPHLFRHSRAMHLYQNGMDLTLISQWLGHSNLETTLIYAHADVEQKRIAIEAASTSLESLKNSSTETYRIDDETLLKRLYGLK